MKKPTKSFKAEMNLPKLIEQFGDDEKCRARLTELRWPKGVTCPRCQSKSVSRVIGSRPIRLQRVSLSVFGNERNYLSRYSPSVVEVVSGIYLDDRIEERHVCAANEAHALLLMRRLGISAIVSALLCVRLTATF